MRKIIYVLLFVVASYQLSMAQCTPNAYSGNHGYILPDSANFPHATKGQAFNTAIQLQVAHDTTGTFVISGNAVAGNFVFDSITIHQVYTIPALQNGTTIQYTCNPGTCKFPGASNGCVNVNVAATGTAHAGAYRIYVIAVGKGTFTPTAIPTLHLPQTVTDTVNWYKLIIDSTGGTSLVENINDFNFNQFSFLNLKPNPATDAASVEFYSPKATTVKLNVMDMIGRNVISNVWSAKNGINKNDLNIAQLPNGIYLVNFEFDGRNFCKKLVVKH